MKAQFRNRSIPSTKRRVLDCLLPFPSCRLPPAVCLLLSAFCLVVHAQPGMPQPSSPLYGARPETGRVSTGLPPALQKVGIDQHLNEQVPLDAVFKDESGNTVQLGQYFGKRPVVLSLVYYSCPMLCNQVLNGMAGALQAAFFQSRREVRNLDVTFLIR